MELYLALGRLHFVIDLKSFIDASAGAVDEKDDVLDRVSFGVAKGKADCVRQDFLADVSHDGDLEVGHLASLPGLGGFGWRTRRVIKTRREFLAFE